MAFDSLKELGYQIEFHSHSEAILLNDFPQVINELESVLRDLQIPVEMLVAGGGGETESTQSLRHSLNELGWRKHNFKIQKTIDDEVKESISHQIDHVRNLLPKGKIAMEIEWNNKDPFFDRDLENFKRLHADSAISAGIILTRGQTLQENIEKLILRFALENKITSYDDLKPFDVEPTSRQKKLVQTKMKETRQRIAKSFAEAWADVFCSDKYGQATTHWGKLEDRVRRGVGNPCPLLLIGIPSNIITFAE